MSLLRTILGFVIFLILIHVGLVYIRIGRGENVLTEAVYSLGQLLESPAAALITAVPAIQEYLNPSNFYAVAFAAAGLYLILYFLLGIGKRS